MKILSKFTDYYDFSCGFHSDETTYDRKLTLEESSEKEKKLLRLFNKIMPSSNYRDRKDKTELLYTYGYIVVANVTYPFIRVTKKEWINQTWKTTLTKYFYEVNEELKSLYNPYVFKHIENFFKNPPVLKLEYPIGLIQSDSINVDNSLADNTDHKFSYKKVLYNIRLKDYKFPIEGRLILQEIEVFLNKEKDETKDVITDDKVLLLAKGFDNKSFKNMN